MAGDHALPVTCLLPQVGRVDRLLEPHRAGDTVLTKNEARALVRECTSRPELLNSRVLDLPRHVLGELLVEVAASALRVG